MLLPSALGFSPHPPVSVYGTGTVQTIAAFLDSWLTQFTTKFRYASRLRLMQDGFSNPATTSLAPGFPFPALLPFPCPRSSDNKGCRNLLPAVHRIRISASP